MRIFIAGVDGYLGWSLAQHLAQRGHLVGGCDNGARRRWVREMGSDSVFPILSMPDRLLAFKSYHGSLLQYQNLDLLNYDAVVHVLKQFKPDAIVHLGEMPSAPYSMIDACHATYTHSNNVNGTLHILWAMKEVCHDAALIKLGTMGEYGTPNIDITEGNVEIEYHGRKDMLPFPKMPGSFYHATKCHDSTNINLACRIWGLTATDINQGVVYGTQIPAMAQKPHLRTRFDIDQAFGTAINRFCAQSIINMPLTLYGAGFQRRGFLPLRDAMQCLSIAIENPPESGTYRVINQFEEVYSLTDLARNVQTAARDMGWAVDINNIDNPRTEAERHYYNPDHVKLLELGYKPTSDMLSELRLMLQDLLPYRETIAAHKDALTPDIRWDGTKRKSRVLYYAGKE